MWKYICKRILVLIPLIFLVSFIVYALMDFAPGDPVMSLVGENMTEEQLEQKREELGFNDPLIVRYVRYMKGVFQGDFGESLYGGKDVLTEYMSRLPYTLKLAGLAILITILLAIPLGVIAAVKHNSWIDTVASTTAMMGLSIPGFWLGLMLMLLFAVQLEWLPTSGAEDGFRSYIMPAITLAVGNASLSTRTTRSSMLDQIRADYLRTARAEGVSEKAVILKHALRNALIPVVTVVTMQIGRLIGGAVVTETVFALPGVGREIVDAILSRDYPVVMGMILVVAALVVVTNALVDVLYILIDPRISTSSKS